MSGMPPILEFDEERKAIINPIRRGLEVPPPETGILCFFADVIDRNVQEGLLKQIGQFRSEMGIHLVYQMRVEDKEIFVMHPGVGAPLAAGLCEEMICWGAKNIVVCGGCGVLNKDLAAGHIVVVDAAVRDEGTSYHYLAPSREIEASQKITKAIERTLNDEKLPFLRGKTWTTDGYYRETAERRQRRVNEGCVVVEMEAAALFAVAKFRKVNMGMLVYGGDLVLPDEWDHRDWYKRGDDRQNLFQLAVKTCSRL